LVETLRALGVEYIDEQERDLEQRPRPRRNMWDAAQDRLAEMVGKAGGSSYDMRRVKHQRDTTLDLMSQANGTKADRLSVHNLYLKATAKATRPDLAEIGLREMRGDGVFPDAFSYRLVIEACARGMPSMERAKHWLGHMRDIDGIQPKVEHYNVLIRACVEKADISAAERWLGKMLVDGVDPTIKTYQNLLNACAKQGDVQQVERWKAVMEKRGIRMDDTTYATIFNTCVEAKDIKRAEHWIHAWAKAGLQPSLQAYTKMIILHEGSSRRAEYWMREMQANRIRPNAVAFNSLIDVCVSSGRMDRAEYWLDRMSSFGKGIKPNSVTFGTLIKGYSLTESFAGIDSALDRLLDRKIKPSTIIFSQLMRACSLSTEKGTFEKAEEYVRKIVEEGVEYQGDVDMFCDLAELCVARNRLDRLEYLTGVMLRGGLVPTQQASRRIVRLLKRHAIKKKLMPEGYFFD